MIAAIKTSTQQTQLEAAHYTHLKNEGFTPEEIATLEGWGVKSVGKIEAMQKLHIKLWDPEQNKHVGSSGLYFPFANNYGQIRLDSRIVVEGKERKYLGPSAPATAWVPPGHAIKNCEALTEGYKDAARATLSGAPTVAIVGVSNIIYSVPQGCGVTTIFDSDGWTKPAVIEALVDSAIWTEGKINLLPQMQRYETGGVCEFFLCHNTVADYRNVIAEALTPAEFLEMWIDKYMSFHTGDTAAAEAARVVSTCANKLRYASKWLKVQRQKVADHKIEWQRRSD